MDERLKSFKRLLDIMDELREKCPWDKKQTMESLRYLTLEEVYELSDAILENNKLDIKNELGDIMLHLVFYSKIAQEDSDFNITDVLNTICDKLISRHPHIYGDVKIKNDNDVLENWEKLKLKEGRNSVLDGVPKSLPSMVKAIRIQEKVKGIGFDWQNKNKVWEKVQEELHELKQEIDEGNIEKIKDEFGDFIFSLINYSRFLKINPEDSLERTNKKFIKRFQKMENQILKDGKKIINMNINEMDIYWEKVKSI